MKTRTAFAMAALGAGLLLDPLAALADDGPKQRLSFSKCVTPIPPGTPAGTVFVFVGMAGGDANGPLTVYGQPGAFERVGDRIYMEADYFVSDPSGRSFTARVGGMMNADGTRRAVLYGFVSDGWMRGAEVVDEFAGTTPGCVAGTLTLTPRWVAGGE
jgi:hypothetical protein